MKTFPLTKSNGDVFAFEVENVGIGRREVCSVVARIPGAQISRRPKLLSWFRDDCFCEFNLDGISFQAAEPFGDNSRYWIGPTDCEPHITTHKVLEAFESHRPFGACLISFVASIGLWLILALGLVAPLTPSTGLPTALSWLIFAAIPLLTATIIFWRTKGGLAKILAAIQLISVIAIITWLLFILH